MSPTIGNLVPLLACLITILTQILAQASSKVDTDSKNPVAVSSPEKTNFSCSGRPAGYYADIDSDCQIYHMCDEAGRLFTNTCPERTRFQQRTKVCDHWYMVECNEAEEEFTSLTQQATAAAGSSSSQRRYEGRKSHRHSQRVIAKFPYQRDREPSRESLGTSTEKIKTDVTSSTDSTRRTNNQIHSTTATPSPSTRLLESSLASQAQSSSETQEHKSQQPPSPPSYQQQPPLPLPSKSDSSQSPTPTQQPLFSPLQPELQPSSRQQSTQLVQQSLLPPSQSQRQLSFRQQSPQPPKQPLLSSSQPQLKPLVQSSQPQFKPSLPSSQSQFQPSSRSHTLQPQLLRSSSNRETTGLPSFETQSTLSTQPQSTQPQSTLFQISSIPPPQQTYSASTQISSSTISPRRPTENVFLISNSPPSGSSTSESQSGFKGIAFNNPGGTVSQVRYVTPYREAKIERVLIPPRVTQTLSTPPPVPTAPNQYTNNPYFETYFKTSFTISTPTSPRTVSSTNYTAAPEDEKDIEENRIEIVIPDPRKMFYIPDSDNDPGDESEGHSRVLFIDIPLQSNEKIQEVSEWDALNNECPQCHPSYLLPGSCSPCVLIT